MEDYMSRKSTGENNINIKGLLAIIDQIIAVVEDKIKDDNKIKDIIISLIRSPELSDIINSLACNIDAVEELIYNGAFKYLYKFRNIILNELLMRKCKSNLSSSREELEIPQDSNLTRRLEKLGVDRDEAGKLLGKELGKTYSIKDFISPQVEESFIREYAKDLARTISNSCHSSYCVASKLSSYWIKIKDLSELFDWDPINTFYKILFSEEILKNAMKWPLDSLEYELSKPQFKKLKEINDIILKWVERIRQSPEYYKYWYKEIKSYHNIQKIKFKKNNIKRRSTRKVILIFAFLIIIFVLFYPVSYNIHGTIKKEKLINIIFYYIYNNKKSHASSSIKNKILGKNASITTSTNNPTIHKKQFVPINLTKYLSTFIIKKKHKYLLIQYHAMFTITIYHFIYLINIRVTHILL